MVRQVDPPTFARLLQQLLPIALKEPLMFESKALLVCASFDLDSTASEDIISSIKQQFPDIPNQGPTCVLKLPPRSSTDVSP
jgi:hypothetical protein